MRVTSTEVAKKLGLTQPTVSRILNGTPNHRASAETRRKVLETAKEMGYRTSAIGRALRTQKTGVLGFYTDVLPINEMASQVAPLLGALQSACRSRRIDLLLFYGDPDGEVAEVCDRLMDGRVDGVFLHVTTDSKLPEFLAQSSLACLAVSPILSTLPSVTADDEQGFFQLIDYLWARGHRRISFLMPKMPCALAERRLQAFMARLAERGISEPTVIRTALEETVSALSSFWNATHKPTAICCWDDLSALALLRACAAVGIQVPADLAVTGFGGSIPDFFSSQAITTVVVPWSEVGVRALETMLASLNGDRELRKDQLPPRFRPGDTA